MSAPSPAMIAGLGSSHYATAADLLRAVAEAMSHEYRAIADAGFIVSVDAPDLTTGFHTWNYGTSVAQYREIVTAHVEALNHALRRVPPEQVRLHLCYGNYAGPHHMDIGLADVIDILYTARARTLAVGLANPRHRGDWRVFRDHPLPAGWMLCAGAVDTLSPVAESPEAVSDILVRLAGIVGAERLQAAPDCGFASFHRLPAAEATTRLKLAALVEGAHLASASV
jgi:5-methyltetrahydropteroyltriglutamate--homocysteine methyltransferase